MGAWQAEADLYFTLQQQSETSHYTGGNTSCSPSLSLSYWNGLKKKKKKARRNCFLCKRCARLYFYGLYLLTLAIFPVCCTALDLAGSPTKWNNISEKVGILIVWHGQRKLQPSKLMTFSHVRLKLRPGQPLDQTLHSSGVTKRSKFGGLIQHLSEAICPPSAACHTSTQSTYLLTQLQAEICTLCKFWFVFRGAKIRHPFSPGAISELIAVV